VKFERSSIAHVITPDELHVLSTKKGLQVLHLSCPEMTECNNIEFINWTLDTSSYKKLSTLDFSTSNVALVTRYEDVKAEKKLAFVGSVPSAKPRDDDYILLGLFLVTNIDPREEEVNVQDFSKYVTKQNTTSMWVNPPDITIVLVPILT